MVSVSKPMSSGQAGQYFSKEDYYSKSQGEWFGKAVEAYGLDQGSLIDKEDFQKMTEGKDLNGNQIICAGGSEQTHRAGTDMTFSPSKSVSILSLTDERVVQAHDAAVKAALSFYDENFAQVRETNGGTTEKVQSQGSAWGLFNHQTSRELDVQLHTHAFKLNASLDSNGQLRADCNDNMYKQQMMMGAVYHSELAKNIDGLGYKIEDIDRRTGTFEVAGINKELMADMSSRREQVLERAKELKEQFPNLPEAKINEMAALDSRQAKANDIDKEFLENRWEQAAVDRGTTMMGEKENAKAAGLVKEKNSLSATDVVKLAANSLLQTESTFSQKDLLGTAAKLSIGNFGIVDLNKAINQLYKSKELVNLDRGGMLSQVTTPAMRDAEKQIVNHIKDNATSQEAFYTPKIARQVVDTKYQTLSDNQKEFVSSVLSSKSQVVLVQGFSGAGKTYAAGKVADEAREFGYTVRAFGPTAAAARQLGSDIGEKGMTLDKFYMSDPASNSHDKGKELWIVDEASMIGSKSMVQLLERAADPNVQARVILIGDKNQLQSVSAGRIFSDLQKTGVTETLQLTDIKRQTSEHMIDAAGKIRDINQVVDALKVIEDKGQLHEIKDFQQRVDIISNDYVNSDPDKTMLVVSTNKERHELNKSIHDKLQAEGKISEVNHTITMKENKSLSPVEKHFADSYQVGDLIQTSKAGGDIPAGYSGRVTGVDAETNTLTLTDHKGVEKTFNPMENGDNASVYRERQITISEGDKLVFLKNDEGEKGIGVVNGDAGKITSINENGYITVATDKGDVSFNIAQYNNVDLGHAITTYKSQGASITEVLYSADKENYNDFYVAVTRGKENAKVYTPDVEALKESISVEQMKTSTLDFDKEIQELKSNFESETMKVSEIDYAKETAEMNQNIEGATPDLTHEHADLDKESQEMRNHLDNEGGAVAVANEQLDRDDEQLEKEHDQEHSKERDFDL